MKLPPLPGPRVYTAYIVGWSQTRNGDLVDAGIYGEPYPTGWGKGTLHVFSRVLGEASSQEGYQAAHDLAMAIVRKSKPDLLVFQGMQPVRLP